MQPLYGFHHAPMCRCLEAMGCVEGLDFIEVQEPPTKEDVSKWLNIVTKKWKTGART